MSLDALVDEHVADVLLVERDLALVLDRHRVHAPRRGERPLDQRVVDAVVLDVEEADVLARPAQWACEVVERAGLAAQVRAEVEAGNVLAGGRAGHGHRSPSGRRKARAATGSNSQTLDSRGRRAR